MFTNILIGIDGRQGGRDAIAPAQQPAAPDATFTRRHVCAPLLGRGAAAALGLERAEAKRLLEHERATSPHSTHISPSAVHERWAAVCTSPPRSGKPTCSSLDPRGMPSWGAS